MFHVIAADAEDAAHGKARVRADDGERSDIPGADDVFRFHIAILQVLCYRHPAVACKGAYFRMSGYLRPGRGIAKKNGRPKAPVPQSPFGLSRLLVLVF